MKVASKREEKQLIIITRITINTGLFYTRREHIMSTSPAVWTVLSSLSQGLAFTLYTTFLIYIKHEPFLVTEQNYMYMYFCME